MQVIDREYQVVKALGQGMAGEVFLVEKGDQLLALKLLKSTIGNLSPTEAAAHFKAEFSILKQLSHPHIARIVDFGTDAQSGRHYFTSEYIEGRDLFSETRQVSQAEMEELFIQALRALEYLQSHGISHFDIKPENLLVHESTRVVKLIDFGLAGFRPRGQLAGTPAYMAPEVVLGNRPDARADLYSLGVTFYECVTGSNPFRAKNLAETLRRQENLMVPPATEVSAKIPAAFSEVLLQIMRKNPAERPSTAGAALRMLARLAGKKITLETEATRLSYLPNETQLIGREKEIETFQKLLREVAQAPRDQACLRGLVVVGGSGMGKSRLLQEFRFHAQLAGLRAVSLGANQEFPEITEPTCLLADGVSPGVFTKLRIQAMSAGQPVLLLVALEKEPATLGELSVVELKPFAIKNIQEYLASLTGLSDAPKELAQELLNRSQGSPQFLTEILSALIRGGSLLDEHGRWTAAHLEDLGVDFSQAKASAQLEARFAKDFAALDGPAQELLRWVAPAPTGVGVESLQSAAEVEDLPFWILDLTNRGLLKRDPDARRFEFVNPLFGEWIVSQMSEKELAKRHARFVEALGASAGNAEQRLYHLGRSGKGAESRKALIDLARELDKKNRSREALANLQLAEKISGENLEDLTEAQLKIAEQFVSLGDWPQAEQTVDALQAKIGKLPDDAANLKIKSVTLQKIGGIYIFLNAFGKAEAALQAFLKLFPKVKNGENWRKLVCENYLGRIHFQRGDHAKALEIFTRTQQEWESFGPEQKKLVQNNDLGIVLIAFDRAREAQKQFEKELAFYQEIGNTNLQAKAFLNLGDAAIALKDYDRTSKEYKRAAELAKNQKNYDILLRAYNGLGNVYHLSHDYEQSLAYYERALSIAQKVGDFTGQTTTEINIGIIHNLGNRPVRALPHLKMALTLASQMENKGFHEKYLIASSRLELGDVYRKMLQFEEAAKQLHEGEVIAGSDKNLAHVNFNIGLTRAKLLFDQGKVEEARRLQEKLSGESANAEQNIELAKLGNYLSGSPPTEVREPAVTEASLGSPRGGDATLFFSHVGENAYAKLLELTRYINAETNLDYVLRSVLQYALELSGAERGLILLLDENDRLETKAAINTALNPALSEISTRVAEQALRSGEILETDDATQDERFNEFQSVMILKLRSILCLPIRSRNKTVGVLYLDHRYRPGVFNRARLPLLQAFCDQAGMAIENARLFEKYEKVQAELKKRLEEKREEAEHYHELLGENAGLPPTRYAYDKIVAKSKPMYEVFKTLDKITETNISVFINGETGTGKELIAKALHYNSAERAKQRFVAINCGGIPANLIESELFGYKAGAFTGASRDKKGLFVEADGGTLFMDEVADLDIALQVKLLRALEEGEVIPVGDVRPVRFNVRIVSASHKPLEDLIREGKFREDLYYRICQIRIPLPPLRDRPEDIPLLVDKFAGDYAEQHGWKKAAKLSTSLMKKLIEYDWPGNVRELENTIRVACALSDKGELTLKHLPENFGVRFGAAPARRESSAGPSERPAAASDSAGAASIDAQNRFDSRRTWEDYEKLIFAKAFEAAEFKPLEGAKILDVSPATFYKRIKDFDLNNKSNLLYNDPFHGSSPV